MPSRDTLAPIYATTNDIMARELHVDSLVSRSVNLAIKTYLEAI